MVTLRTALAGGSLAIATLTATACVQLNEAINRRDLECGEVPDNICSRIADDIARQWDAANATQDGPIVTVTVAPTDCFAIVDKHPLMPQCWEVEAHTTNGSGVAEVYYQDGDRNLVSPYRGVIGTFPVE